MKNTRRALMILNNQLPNVIAIEDCFAFCSYNGVQLQCRKCHSTSHLVASCPAIKCLNCQSLCHSAEKCPKQCKACKSPNHDFMNCPVRYSGPNPPAQRPANDEASFESPAPISQLSSCAGPTMAEPFYIQTVSDSSLSSNWSFFLPKAKESQAPKPSSNESIHFTSDSNFSSSEEPLLNGSSNHRARRQRIQRHSFPKGFFDGTHC